MVRDREVGSVFCSERLVRGGLDNERSFGTGFTPKKPGFGLQKITRVSSFGSKELLGKTNKSGSVQYLPSNRPSLNG